MTSTQELNCILCKETFDNKEDLQVHFRKHGDPKFNQGQQYKSRSKNESELSSDKQPEQAEMVSCDVCSEKFPTISKAITHKHKLHPDHDAKYFCPWCGKLFTMKHLYNKHIQSAHDKAERSNNINYHCDVCNVNFYIASAMLSHNKYFHRQDTDLPSIGQSKKLKNVNQDILQIYYCAFCGEEYDNKVNLHKHMGDDHSDENQSPEDVLRCPLCEAIFYHLDAYEIHLMFHSKDDLYSEPNELFDKTEDFSLETVPPMMEKVETVEPPEVETAETIGLDALLGMAMDDDNEHPKKSKKRKKHKKSKKSAITLDEFLNMNKDVFGDGIDFQGIEEIPTQVVTKRLKTKKVNKPTGSLKVVDGTDIEKLKKQGIVVKKKQSKAPPIQNFKLAGKISKLPMQIPKQSVTNKPNVQTPHEVLSKLLNQSNSQLKIVKKQNQGPVNEEPQINISNSEIEKVVKVTLTPENIEVECDVLQSGYTSSETDAKEENISQNVKETNNTVEISSHENNVQVCDDKNTTDQNMTSEKELTENDSNEKQETVNENEIEKINSIINIKNLSQNVTVKSLSSPHKIDKVQESEIDIKHENNTKEDILDNNSNTPPPEKPHNETKNSLDALKHLSKFITVKSLNSKPLPDVVNNKTVSNLKENASSEDENQNFEKKLKEIPKQQEILQANNKNDTQSSIEGLKSLNKHFRMKSLPNVANNMEEKFSSDDDEEPLKRSPNIPTTPNVPNKPTYVNKEVNVKSTKQLPKVMQINKNAAQTNISEQIESQNKNTDILKRLTNITAKPVSSAKSNQLCPEKISNAQRMAKRNMFIQKEIDKKINDDIEIFHIEDSDSEEDKSNSNISQTNALKAIPTKTTHESYNNLNSLSKNITVKPTNIQTLAKNIVTQKPKVEDFSNHSQNSMSDFSDDEAAPLHKTKLKIYGEIPLKRLTIQNTLKNLGKHITVKSNNSSSRIPNKNITSNFSPDSGENMYDSDSDNDHIPGKVKITEVTDECDQIENEFENCKDIVGNVTVQSPGASNSDNDNNFSHDSDGGFSDFESQLQACTIKKPIKNKQACTVKTVNKNITSTNKDSSEIEPPQTKHISGLPIGLSRELSIKPIKHAKIETDSDSVINKKSDLANIVRTTSQSVQQNVQTNKQLNTVNKEVTVKTFQTQTVIEEITTTVTKTIKTVNQTVKKQQHQSTNQVGQPVRFQNVQRINTNPHIKNFQGVTVRNAAPPAGTKVRGMLTVNTPTMSPARPVNPVRPSNQLIPVRQAAPNAMKTAGPRMAVRKKPIGPTLNQHNIIGTQLKVAPSAVNTTTKRATEETVNHFSCFKKPKESLIPVSDVTFDNSHGNESSVQYTSASSASSFSSVTKTVKGNSVVTATQMKSESSSSQHLSKLNSISGLTIVKSNQSKQAVQVDKSEANASKRNTLEAIEKLQKQGLLVKKPRLDACNDSEPSDEEDQYFSDEPN